MPIIKLYAFKLLLSKSSLNQPKWANSLAPAGKQCAERAEICDVSKDLVTW